MDVISLLNTTTTSREYQPVFVSIAVLLPKVKVTGV